MLLQKEKLYFIKDDIADIENNILTISKEQINNLLDKIHTNAQHNLIEIDILTTFLWDSSIKLPVYIYLITGYLN